MCACWGRLTRGRRSLCERSALRPPRHPCIQPPRTQLPSTGRGSARKLAQVTPTGILYSDRVKDLSDLAVDDEAAELEAAAQVWAVAWQREAGQPQGVARAACGAACCCSIAGKPLPWASARLLVSDGFWNGGA